MDAGSVVDLFASRMGGQFNRTILLTEIRLAQNEILALPGVPLMRNKTPEYLVTTSGVYSYAVPNRRTVQRIFTRAEDSVPSLEYGRPQRLYSGVADQVNINGVQFCENSLTFECVDANSPDDAGCTVYFSPDVDPGNTTTTYRMETYRWPVQPVTESTLMEMPDPWISSLLFYAVKRKVEEAAYGVDIYNDPKFMAMLVSFTGQQARRSSQENIIRKPRF